LPSNINSITSIHNRTLDPIIATVLINSPKTKSKTKMNATSLLPPFRPANLAFTIISSPSKSNPNTTTSSPQTTTPTPSPSSNPRLRPKHLRRVSSDSTGWYLDADTPSLKDFEIRAGTLAKRLEKFANRCATNVVMGLMSPAAVVLFVFNPVMLVVVLVLLVAMVGGRS
jgi:hypothetical protein